MFMLCCLLLSGCTSNKKDDNTLIIGMDDTFAPMGFKNDEGEIVGFDVELAKEVGKIIGKTFTFQNIDWDLKETELQNRNIDLLWNGYSITEKRKENVLFSDPYLENKQIIITLKDSGITCKEDLVNKTVSVQKNSSAYEAASKDTQFISQLKNKELVQLETNNDCFMDLEAKRSDAIIVDETLARYYMKQQNKDIYLVLEDNFGVEEYGIGMRKDETELANQINDALKQLKNNGKFDEIKSKWFS